MMGTVPSTFQNLFNVAGFKGTICDKCHMPMVTSIPNSEGSDTIYELPSAESLHHICKVVPREFESEQEKLEQDAKSEEWLINMLMKDTRM
jgi:hypothetical protein